jgi:hypothetical protein
METSYDDTPAPVIQKDPAEKSNEERLVGSEFKQPPRNPRQSGGAIEEDARKEGWVDEDEWAEQGRAEALWRPASVFLERGVHFRTMSDQKRQITKLEKMVGVMTQMQKNIRSDERSKTLADLKERKMQAMEADNFREAEAVDAAIKQHNEVSFAEDRVYDGIHSEVTQPGAPDPGLVALAAKFKAESPWYFTDPAMRAYGDTLSNSYRAIHPQSTAEEVVAYVTKEVPRQFKGQTDSNDNEEDDQKETRSRTRRSPVGGSATTTGRTSQRGQKRSVRDLPQEYQDIYKRFKEAGAVKNEEEYLSQIDLTDGQGATYE